MRILLVSREGRLSQRTRTILNTCGHTVYFAPNARDAVRLAEALRPERVVASIDGDFQTGSEAIRSIRQRSLARDFLFVSSDHCFTTPADLSDIPVLHEPLFAVELLTPIAQLASR